MQALNGPLSPREKDCIRLLADDVSPSRIEKELCLHRSTVKYYLQSIRTKLRVETNHGAVAKWLREGGV